MNENNNPIRTTTKESDLSEADLNINNCNTPSKIANSQTYLTTYKRSRYIFERKLYLEDKLNSELIRKASNNLVIFGDSITNFRDIIKISSIKKSMIAEKQSNIF